jgi:hypothetical protein
MENRDLAAFQACLVTLSELLQTKKAQVDLQLGRLMDGQSGPDALYMAPSERKELVREARVSLGLSASEMRVLIASAAAFFAEWPR